MASQRLLLDQFLQDSVNTRIEEYGGSEENRIWLPLEVADAFVEFSGYGNVEVKILPLSTSQNTLDIEEDGITFVSLVGLFYVGFSTSQGYEC